MPDLVCKRCDVFVGFGAAGVVNPNVRWADKDREWLATHCWACGRSAEEIEREQNPPVDRLGLTFDPLGSEVAWGPPHDPVLQTPPTMTVKESSPWRPLATPIDSYIASYLGEPRGGVVKDVAFNRKSFGPDQPENPDQDQIYVGLDGIRVELVQDFDDAELRKFFSFAINATRGIDPENPPEPVDWEEMMRGGLQTALKRINIAFAVYGASRTATHQIVRSTRANFHQQSQRAHYYGDRPSVRMPESWLGKAAPEGGERPTFLAEEFERLAEHAAEVYRLATDAGVSYQDARFALLEGTTNFILCEYSLDEFIAVYGYRGCSMFQWEIVGIMREMRAVLLRSHPWLEPYIKISCEKTKGALDKIVRNPDGSWEGTPHVVDGTADALHACTFQGWERVEGQCDFPWARETNRTFRSDRHEIANKSKEV